METTRQERTLDNGTSGTGTSGTAIPDSSYNTMQHEAGGSSARKAIVPLVVIVALTGGGYFAYEMFVNNKSPAQILAFLQDKGQELIALALGEDESTPPPPAGGQEIVVAPPVATAPAPPVPVPPPVSATDPVAADSPESEMPAISDFPPEGEVEQKVKLPSIASDNPYLYLPNPRPESEVQFGRAWSQQEEEVWRSGITHQFAWQQYKTVQDITSMRLAGSDAILWEALNNPRLWTRMKAVTGLVMFGTKVDVDAVIRALGDASPSLVANYFKRFTVRSKPSERFVMRYALHTVAPRARLHIIEALVAGNDETSDLYLRAASLDADHRVSRWAKMTLDNKGLPAITADN